MSLVRAFSTSGLTKPKSVTLALFAHRLVPFDADADADENHNNDQNIFSEPCSLART